MTVLGRAVEGLVDDRWGLRAVGGVAGGTVVSCAVAGLVDDWGGLRAVGGAAVGWTGLDWV